MPTPFPAAAPLRKMLLPGPIVQTPPLASVIALAGGTMVLSGLAVLLGVGLGVGLGAGDVCGA